MPTTPRTTDLLQLIYHKTSYLSYLSSLKSFLDENTSWVDHRIKFLNPLPDASTMIKIHQLIKRNYPRFPPPTDDISKLPAAKIPTMEYYIPTPESAHKVALKRILEGELPYHNMLRWADYWSENADAYFKFEIIAIRPNLITGTFKC
jgi:hypothetical protein